jgi:hypothetical protein
MERGIIFFIVFLSGLLIAGIIKNIWTRFAIMCLIITLVSGVLVYVAISLVHLCVF